MTSSTSSARPSARGGSARPGRHPVWATELWWDTNPPDAFDGVSLIRHARWIEQALYLLWSQGASAVLTFQVRDSPPDPANPFADSSTGLFLIDGTPKPALTAFRFPLVADRLKPPAVRVWGKAPRAGRLVIERRESGRWHLIEAERVSAGEVFSTRVDLPGPHRLRARIGAERSLTWRLGGGG